MGMKTFITEMHCGKDNETPDIARILCSLCIITVLFLAIWDATYHVHNTDFASLGACIAQVLGATGLAIKLKENSEPSIDQKKDSA